MKSVLKKIEGVGGLLINKKSYGSLHLIFAQTFFTLTLFVIDILFANQFSKSEFGLWKQLLLLINFLIPFFVFGVPEGYKYYSVYDKKRNKIHFKNSVILTVLITIIVLGLVALGLFDYYAKFMNAPQLSVVKWFVPLLFLAVVVSKILKYAAVNFELTKKYMISMLISAFFTITYFGVFLYFFEDNKSSFLIFIVLGLILGYFLRGALLLTQDIGFDLHHIHELLNKKDIKRYFSYGIPLFVTTFISIITLNTDKTIISHFQSIDDFAVYSIGAREVPFVSMIASSIGMYQFPKLVQLIKSSKHSFAKKIWLDATYKVSLVVYPIVLILMVSAEPLITFIFGEVYADAVPIFKTYLLIFIWRNNYYGALLSASGNTRWITFYSLITMILNIGFSITFYFLWGAIGVAIATFISVTIANMLQLNHENMIASYFRKIVLNPYLGIMILLIISAYFFI